jgi:hypothetical protein
MLYKMDLTHKDTVKWKVLSVTQFGDGESKPSESSHIYHDSTFEDLNYMNLNKMHFELNRNQFRGLF